MDELNFLKVELHEEIRHLKFIIKELNDRINILEDEILEENKK